MDITCIGLDSGVNEKMYYAKVTQNKDFELILDQVTGGKIGKEIQENYTQLSGHLGRYRFIRQVLGDVKPNLCGNITDAFDFVFHHPLVTVERDFQFFHLAHDFLYG